MLARHSYCCGQLSRHQDKPVGYHVSLPLLPKVVAAATTTAAADIPTTAAADAFASDICCQLGHC